MQTKELRLKHGTGGKMFNFDEWKDKNVVMHCKTQEEAEAFCKEMDE